MVPRLGGRIAERLGPKRVPESEIQSRYKDVAFAVQDFCEQAMKGITELALKKTGCRKLCMAGGVALNSKANGLILDSGLAESIFIQPAASDDGVALGAVLAPYLETGARLPLKAMRQVYLGAAYDDAEIEKVLRTYKLRWSRLGDVPGTTAELLAAGKIIGWFQGRMEFGPRALGSRSILADPRDPEMNSKVNNAVKFREWWRPFAPSMLAEAATDFMESVTDSPFMILATPVKPEKRSVIPAVTHVDGSARPQTVEEKVNPLYWRVIKEFGQRTGVPVVMNTSFNLRGEAIVELPPMPSDVFQFGNGRPDHGQLLWWKSSWRTHTPLPKMKTRERRRARANRGPRASQGRGPGLLPPGGRNDHPSARPTLIFLLGMKDVPPMAWRITVAFLARRWKPEVTEPNRSCPVGGSWVDSSRGFLWRRAGNGKGCPSLPNTPR